MVEDFGRYRLERKIGQGGMAEVFLAIQQGPQGYAKPCVLKRISPPLQANLSVLALFREEAKVSALLQHPSIVQTFDYGEIDGQPYMAMELVDGANLGRFMQALAAAREGLPPRVAVEIVARVADALDHAHRARGLTGQPLALVHRDVSPTNILIARSGEVKLADFGIARHDERDYATQGAGAKGKPGYMPPEQAMGTTLDGRADLFSLGVVLVELLTHQRVSPPGQAVRGINELPKRIAALLAATTRAHPALAALARSMTALDPADRPATAGLASAELMDLARDLTPPTLLEFIPPAMARIFPQAASPTGVGSVTALFGTTAAQPSTPSVASPSPSPGGWAGAAPGDAGWSMVDLGVTWLSGPPDAVKEDTPELAAVSLPPVPRSYLPGTHAANRAASVPRSTAPPRASIDPSLDPTLDPSRPSGLELARLPIARGTPAQAPSRNWLWPAVGVTALVILAAGGIGAYTRVPPPPPTTRVEVTSQPPGARVLMNGADTGKLTPAELNLEIGVLAELAVSLDGFLPQPERIQVRGAADTPRAAAAFTLARARRLRIETEPPGATVELSGRLLPGTTPLTLPPMPAGATPTIALALDGFAPVWITSSTVTIAHVALEPARTVSVDSTPSGASVWVEGRRRGETPLPDLVLPSGRRIELRLELAAHRPLTQKLDLSRLKTASLSFTLTERPMSELPLTPAERREIAGLTQRQQRLRAQVAAARANLRAKERKLDQVSSSIQTQVTPIAEATAAVEDAQARLQRIEDELAEVDQALEGLRTAAMQRAADQPRGP